MFNIIKEKGILTIVEETVGNISINLVTREISINGVILFPIETNNDSMVGYRVGKDIIQRMRDYFVGTGLVYDSEDPRCRFSNPLTLFASKIITDGHTCGIDGGDFSYFRRFHSETWHFNWRRFFDYEKVIFGLDLIYPYDVEKILNEPCGLYNKVTKKLEKGAYKELASCRTSYGKILWNKIFRTRIENDLTVNFNTYKANEKIAEMISKILNNCFYKHINDFHDTISLYSKVSPMLKKFNVAKIAEMIIEEDLIYHWYDDKLGKFWDCFLERYDDIHFHSNTPYSDNELEQMYKTFGTSDSMPGSFAEALAIHFPINMVITEINKYTRSFTEIGREIEWKNYFKNIAINRKIKVENSRILLNRSKADIDEIIKTFSNNININGYTVPDSEFIVVTPTSLDDLRKESNNQHNCVFTNYSKKILKGTTHICFIRKQADIEKSYITCEIKLSRAEDGLVHYGLGDCLLKGNSSIARADNSLEIESFLDALTSFLKKIPVRFDDYLNGYLYGDEEKENAKVLYQSACFLGKI